MKFPLFDLFWAERRLAVKALYIGSVIFLAAAIATTIYVRQHLIYRNAIDIALLTDQFNTYRKERAARDEMIQSQLNELERTAYDVADKANIASAAARRPSSADIALKTLRDDLLPRLRALEQFRYRAEPR